MFAVPDTDARLCRAVTTVERGGIAFAHWRITRVCVLIAGHAGSHRDAWGSTWPNRGRHPSTFAYPMRRPSR